MFFGTPVWPLEWSYPYDKTIKRIADLGFKGVELIGWDAEALNNYYTAETCASLKKLIADLGLILTNFNYTPRGLTSEREAEREESLGCFKRAVDVAYALGAQNVTSVAPYPFPWNDGFPDGTPQIMALRHVPEVQVWTINADLNKDWKGAYDSYAGYVKKCCAYAGQAGFRLLIEPHPYRVVNSASSMLRLIEHVKADNLGMNFDPSHLFPQGDMPQVTIYQLADRIGHTHFSDNDTLTNVHWRPGKGKIDWYAVMKALKDVGYDGVLSLELEDVPGAVTPDAATATGLSNSMEIELRLTMEFLTKICDSLGITLT